MTDGNSIYESLNPIMVLGLVCVALSTFSKAYPTGQSFCFADEFFYGGDIRNSRFLGVPLFTQPTRVVGLCSGKPWVDQNVEVDSTSTLCCGDWTRDHKQPCCVGAQVMKNRSAHGKSITHGILQVLMQLCCRTVHVVFLNMLTACFAFAVCETPHDMHMLFRPLPNRGESFRIHVGNTTPAFTPLSLHLLDRLSKGMMFSMFLGLPQGTMYIHSCSESNYIQSSNVLLLKSIEDANERPTAAVANTWSIIILPWLILLDTALL